MTLGILVGGIIKTSALTILAEVAMKSIEQKDYARLIKFTGISQIASDVVQYIHYINENPPLLWRLTKESWDGWKGFLNFIGIGD
jgi:hypothetical protein